MKNYLLVTAVILLFCYLFANIAISKTVKNNEKVIFLPTYGKIQNNNIYTEVHMWIFQPEENSITRNIITSSIIKLFLDDEEFKNSEIFDQRLKAFMVDNERNKKLTVIINGNEYMLNPSKPDGHSITKITVPFKPGNSGKKSIEIKLKTMDKSERDFSNYITLENPDGISVISDIDDTIKISNVLNKKELIKNTFIRPFQAVNKMPEFYSQLYKNNISFHYVSGSPWQLYESISGFMKNTGFPEGSFYLKKFRIKDKSFIDFLIADQKEYKVTIIKAIIKDFPEKKFILIGDSGEMDAEIYSELYKLFPENIKAVFIRNTGNLDDEKDRFENIQKQFSNITFSFFSDGNDLIKLKDTILK
ncbi:MAG: App1 family protein [Spirochaetes bacterium]|nr:App1 family protein [Spirochaetota bacterium]